MTKGNNTVIKDPEIPVYTICNIVKTVYEAYSAQSF